MTKKEGRRGFLAKLAVGISALAASPLNALNKVMEDEKTNNMAVSNKKIIKKVAPLGFQWETQDPFLFCVHHEDDFPAGNADMGPVMPLHGRDLGNDFIIKDGFRMYHGKKVPGFPGHPHKGFETITIVRKGMVDHADSIGAAGRYGDGDVQWMTAGKGVQHSEMFPLIHSDKANPLELFQIWLNLPAKSKLVDPHFLMLWSEHLPKYVYSDAQGNPLEVEVIAGKIGDTQAPPPPPNSWAANPNNELAVWNIHLSPNVVWEMPKASEGINRTLYFYQGETINIAGETIKSYHAVEVVGDAPLKISNGNHHSKILVLQGKPINEVVMQYGPFVMNSKEEIQQAFNEFHQNQFGGWPWPKYDMTHDRNAGRFAKHADGTIERKG
jgi:redox-sensitive bicupin YhaK (pirin superfamily)